MSEKKLDINSVFIGFSFVASVFQDKAGDKIGMFLGGMYDHEIQLAMFFREHNKVPETIEELKADEKSSAGLERMKNMYRHALNDAIRREMEREYAEKAEALKKTFAAMHAKAPEGTVRELAAKYNKSIGEIRKMKAEGRLHELQG